MGNIKLYKGDCVKILSKLEKGSIDIVLSDIPFCIDYGTWDTKYNNTNSSLGGSSPAQKLTSFTRRCKPLNGWSKEDRKIGNHYYKWCKRWCKQLFRLTKEASPILLFTSRRFNYKVCEALDRSGFIIKDVLVWKKNRCNPKQSIRKGRFSYSIFSGYYSNSLCIKIKL